MNWIAVGNIKGADGTAELPDPLPVETQLNLGDDLRMVTLPNGGKIEARAPNGTWVKQVEWTQPNP